MKNKTVNIIMLLLMMAVGVFYIFTATGLQGSRNTNTIGAGYFPVGLGIFLEVLCAIKLVQLFRESKDKEFALHNSKLLLVVLALTAAYFIAWKTIGYFYAITAVYAMVLLTILRPQGEWKKHIVKNIILTGVFVACLYLIFGVTLQLSF